MELEAAPQPKLILNYRLSDAKLSAALAFTPSRTVLGSIENMLQQIPCDRSDDFGDSQYYNVRWM